MAKTNIKAKIAGFAAAAALSAMMLPGMAFAADYSNTAVSNSTTAPDNVVVVKWTEGADTFSCNVDLDALTKHTSKMGALFKQGVKPFTVLGADEYVTLSDVIGAAYVDVNSAIGTVRHTPASVWDNDSDYIVFDVWNTKKNDDGSTYQIVETYAKYNNGDHATGYTKAKLASCNNFYGNTVADTLVADSDTPEYNAGAILALKSATQLMTAGDTTTTAATVLNNFSSTSAANSPRLMWGHEEGNTAGNRFPSNIDVITINDVA